MAPAPVEVALTVRPRARIDMLDVRRRVSETHGDALDPFPLALYSSYHTTAGYLDQSLATRLNPQARRCRVVPVVLPHGVPRGGGLQTRPARPPRGAVRGGTADRAAQRRLASRVHQRRPAELRDLPGPERRAGVLHRPRRRLPGPDAAAGDHGARVHHRGGGGARPRDGADVRASRRLRQPQGSPARYVRALRRAHPAARRRQGPHSARPRPRRGAGRTDRQRVRDPADAPRPRRGPAQSVAVHGREQPRPALRSPVHSEQRPSATPSTTWCACSTSSSMSCA